MVHIVLQDLRTIFSEMFVFVSSVLLVSITSLSFIAQHLPVFEIAKCIARGCLLLFDIVFIIVYICIFIEKHVYTLVGRLHAHLYPCSDECHEVVHCCYTRTTMFTKLVTCLLYQRYGHVTKVHCSTTSTFLECIAWDCLLLLYKNYIVYFIVYVIVR